MTAIGRTMIRQRSVNMIGAGGAKPLSAEVLAWQAAVIANGGTVSAARLKVVNKFIYAEKAAGTWVLTDDYWPLWGENAPQALTSLKQRRLSTAVAAPTFVTDRGYTFNGTTNYLNTNFVAATQALIALPTSFRLGCYETTNVQSGGYAMGMRFNTASIVGIYNRSALDQFVVGLNHGHVGITVAPADGRGYFTGSRADGGTVVLFFKNGVALTPPGTAVTPGAAWAPALPMYIGARNENSVANSFGARSIGFLTLSLPMSPAQEAAQYANVQAWATAVGANV